jgi:hypothetical protein
MSGEVEPGVRVGVNEDATHVLITLDHDHAVELARILAAVRTDRGGHAAWMPEARAAGDDTWLGATLRLIACSQNLLRGT